MIACRYKYMSEDVAEWGKLEEQEFQAKVLFLSDSKLRGKGIGPPQLQAIQRWRKKEEIRKKSKKATEEIVESKKIEEELAKIAVQDTLKAQVKDVSRKASPKKQRTDDNNNVCN